MARPVPSTLSVRVPFVIGKGGGRKLVITPDGAVRAMRTGLYKGRMPAPYAAPS